MPVQHHFFEAIFALSAASAQVWSALMVFHILLVRDLKHHVDLEIDTLWNDAKLWWPKLVLALKNEDHSKGKLSQFGLTRETVVRADTHKNSFIRLIAAIKIHKIASDHLADVLIEDEAGMTPQEWQLKFEPIAERIEELEGDRPGTRRAFQLGIAGVALNLTLCALGGWVGARLSPPLLVLALGANLSLLTLFGREVIAALGHIDIATQHDPIIEQLRDLEDRKRKRGGEVNGLRRRQGPSERRKSPRAS